jgi:phosphatidate cytidylyltransferase
VLRQRVITALLLLALFVAAAAAGRPVLDAAIALLIGAAAFEWLRLAQHSAPLSLLVAAVLAAGLLAVEALASWPRAGMLTAMLAAAAAWVLIAAIVLRGARRGARVPHSASTLLCVVLLAAAWFALMHLKETGLVYLLSVLVIVWLADIAAYFAGRRWGRRKLAPGISPGKTWAGVGGAVAAVLVAAALCAQVAPGAPVFSTVLQQRLPPALALVLLAALVALSVIGDLFESLLKRQVNAKDSGWLLPGHGGVLDRIDALIAVLPAAALLDLWLRR